MSRNIFSSFKTAGASPRPTVVIYCIASGICLFSHTIHPSPCSRTVIPSRRQFTRRRRWNHEKSPICSILPFSLWQGWSHRVAFVGRGFTPAEFSYTSFTAGGPPSHPSKGEGFGLFSSFKNGGSKPPPYGCHLRHFEWYLPIVSYNPSVTLLTYCHSEL